MTKIAIQSGVIDKPIFLSRARTAIFRLVTTTSCFNDPSTNLMSEGSVISHHTVRETAQITAARLRMGVSFAFLFLLCLVLSGCGGSTQSPTAVAGGPYSANLGQAITFDGSKSIIPAGRVGTYSWSFGDGTSGNGTNPTHTYATAGTFTVSLTVSSAGGANSTASATATISAPPVANAGGPYAANLGQSISFDGSKSTPPAGQTLTYAWVFGDGGTATGATPTHTYATAGTFSVTLTVTGTTGGTATASASATVAALPVANAGGPYTGSTGQAVSFDGSGSTAPTGQTLTFAWSFGDGGTAIGSKPTHVYATAGTYTVTLTVTGTSGGTSSATATATIQALSVANAGGPYAVNLGQAIVLDGSKSTAPSGQTLTTYAWTFGDSTTGVGVSPSHTYAAAGTYVVTLTVTSTSGNSASATTSATVNQLPVANAGGPYSGNVGQAITFDGSKSTPPPGQTLTYSWNFGDSGTGTGVGPTHTYATAGTYTATLTVTGTSGGVATATATITVNALPVANAGGPYSASAGQSVHFDASRSTAPAGQTLTYNWIFGDGTTATGVSPIHTYASAGTYSISLTVTASGGGSATVSATIVVTALSTLSPTITTVSPASGSIGTVITVTGTHFTQAGTTTPQVSLSQQGGGLLIAPLTTFTDTTLSFVIPAGSASGPVRIDSGSLNGSSSIPLVITTASTFTINASPSAATLIQGQSTAIAVQTISSNGFSGVVALTVSGLPTGVTASFNPSVATVGQIAILSLTAPSSQSVGASTLTIQGVATVDDQPVMQTATSTLNVIAKATAFLGRTVVDDAAETPIGGVTVAFLGQDGSGRATGCAGRTLSDGAGNFLLTNLVAACTGPQLISYDGSTATSPTGKFAGVNLSYTITSGQVKASPVLIHLPRIDNAETVMVTQNSKTDQILNFQTIPGMKVTVYAGTTITLADGSTPNPFPLVAIPIPLDRLPEQMATSGMLMPFIVAFQPANAFASQPVAVNFPNQLNVAPKTTVTFMTLDPTRGYMVPYGTGTVSDDGSEFVADGDPANPGHGYGLVHFDWHGPSFSPPVDVSPAAPPPPGVSMAPKCDCFGAKIGGPIDIGSGLVSYATTDVAISGNRGGLQLVRTYRTLSDNMGLFGKGTGTNWSYLLNITALRNGGQTVRLLMPDGNQYTLTKTSTDVYTNATIPLLRGATLTGSVSTGAFTLRLRDGTQLNFQVFSGTTTNVAALVSAVDPFGNTTTLTVSAPANSFLPFPISKLTDSVGRSLLITYDARGTLSTITDPLGRKITYTYTADSRLASVTDPGGGVTSYSYDSRGNLVSIKDQRGVITEQSTYSAFDNRVTQQIQADGGVFKFAYTLQNPMVPTSPVLQTVVTDPLGRNTTYRFDIQGFLVSVMDAAGQTRVMKHDPSHHNLISDFTGTGLCSVCGNPAEGDKHYTFDQYGNITSVTDAMGGVTTLGYDNRFGKLNSITDKLGRVQTMKYDAVGSLISVTDPSGSTTQFTYDNFGELTSVTDATGARQSISYDAFGNATQSTDSLGRVTNFSFDAMSRPIQVQDALGHKTQTSYDVLDRVVSSKDANGKQATFTYDPVGDLLSLADELGNATTYTYDSVLRLVSRTSPLKGAQTYAYDLDSNLTQVKDRRGKVTNLSYDAVNRLSSATYSDSTINYNYDAAGRLTGLVDSSDGSFNYKYNADGLLTEQDGPTGTVTYSRDADGNVLSEKVAGQTPINYTFDSVGNMTKAAMGSVGVDYTYDGRGLPLTLTRTNGVTSTYSYDLAGQLLKQIQTNSTSTLNTQLYSYDAVGNRISIADDLAQAFSTQSSTGSVDAGNELLSAGGTTYNYDAGGNRISETTAGATTSYTWDGRNRLSSLTDSKGNKTTFRYGSNRTLLGITRSAGNGPASQTFVTDLSNNTVSMTNDGSVVSVLVGTGLDETYATVSSAGKAEYQLFGPSGPTAVTDSSGALSAKVSYDPYGVATGTPSAQSPLTYSNHLPVSGNILYSHERFYDAGTGTFISEDPIGFLAGDTNLYRYTGNNPTSRADRNGLFGFGLTFGAGGTVGAGTGAAGTAEVGGGAFVNTDDLQVSQGAYASAGGTLKLGSSDSEQTGWPPRDPADKSNRNTRFAVGIAAPSPGLGFFATNARNVGDLSGDFFTTNLTFLIFNFSVSVGCADDGKKITQFGFALGDGIGLALSHYKTNTFATAQHETKYR
jgi:RHS repeat-associated protein